MYNQVIYEGYEGDCIEPNDISSSILDICNDDKRTTTLLKDLLNLSWSLYHISLADSKNQLSLKKDDIDKVSDLDSDTNNTDDDDSDNDHTTETIPVKTKYSKQTKAFDRIESKCRPTSREKEM